MHRDTQTSLLSVIPQYVGCTRGSFFQANISDCVFKALFVFHDADSSEEPRQAVLWNVPPSESIYLLMLRCRQEGHYFLNIEERQNLN